MARLDKVLAQEVERRNLPDPAPEYEAALQFGAQLIALRVAHGWSQRELEDRSGVAQAEISRIERGQVNVSVDRANALLRPFGWVLNASPIEKVLPLEVTERELVPA